MATSSGTTSIGRPSGKAFATLYTLCIYLLDGLVDEDFCGKTVSRTVQIRGDQTLEDLHHIIFKAFDREDEHLYEFNLGVGPDDRSAIYSLPSEIQGLVFDEEIIGDVTTVTIDSLGLTVGRAFGYLFDFGDNWLHQINVIAVEDLHNGRGKYPKIVSREGKSPPQYPDIDIEEE
jgi:hypothetical protein